LNKNSAKRNFLTINIIFDSISCYIDYINRFTEQLKIFYLAFSKKPAGGKLQKINYFKYKSVKYINFIYLYIEIRFGYAKQVWIKTEDSKNNENKWKFKSPKSYKKYYLFSNNYLPNRVSINK